jgi:hypothetical protein
MDLPVELLKLTSLQALNLTGNPLYNKFDRLLQKDASIAPQLKSNLEKCFGLSAGEEEVSIPSFRNPHGWKPKTLVIILLKKPSPRW